MSTTRLQEVLIAFGKGKQTDIVTQASAALWRFSKLNGALANPHLATENEEEQEQRERERLPK